MLCLCCACRGSGPSVLNSSERAEIPAKFGVAAEVSVLPNLVF